MASLRLMLKALPRLVVLVAVLGACGKKAAGPSAKQDAAKPSVAPIALPPLGVDHVARFGFIYGEGNAAYEKAAAAAKAKTRDWSVVRADCEAALTKDPTNLDAHWLLATPLAQAGEHAAAVDHALTAIAADYYKYGPALASDPDLKD